MIEKNKSGKKRESRTADDDVTSQDTWTKSLQTLRKEAETGVLNKALRSPYIETLSPEVQQQLLHELRVHQIELEMQNEQLRESQVALDIARTRYFDLYDLAPVGYCTLNDEGLIMLSNLTTANLLGVTRSALVNQHLSRFVHNDDANSYYLHKKHLLESGEPQSFELRMMKNDGTQLWMHFSTSVAEDADGKHELRFVLTDITERAQAEMALQDLEIRYHDLFKSIDKGFCVIEMIFDGHDKAVDYRYLEVNPGFVQLSGYSDALGKRLSELALGDQAHWCEIYGRVALTGQPVTLVEQIKTLGERWFALHAFPYGGLKSGKVAVLFDDISDQKNGELAMERALVAAEKANRAKSEFLSSMSHELRTPLNAILGFAQLMESATPPPTSLQQGNIAHILKAGWYLLGLINEVLDLSRIESGTMKLSHEPVPLAEVLAECRMMIESQAQQRGIGLMFPQVAIPYVLSADRQRLIQVLINLLSNAIKYNRPGGTVTVECAATQQNFLRVSVRDTGLGMTPEQLAQLFQQFNRLGQENGVEEGTGIGLVVTKRLIEMMGGTVGVESSVGVGSVFWIELRLTKKPQLEPLLLEHATLRRPPAPALTSLRTLLYVEDNPANLMLVEKIISYRADLSLLAAVNGKQGIEFARSHQPAVILMDINLPGISGTDAMKILRADPLTAHIPIIAFSANAMPLDIENALLAGFYSYLTKPIRVNELMDALDLALQRAEQAAGSRN